MKRQILILFLTIISLTAFAQQSTLPAGSLPYGSQYYKAPDGSVWMGASGKNYTRVTEKRMLDSLSNRKQTISTGLVAHGALSAVVGATTFSISAGVGVVSDYTDPYNVKVRPVNITARSGITPAYLTTAPASYIAIDSLNNIVQSAAPFTDIQRRDLIIIGAIIHSNLTNINTVNNIAAPITAGINQLHDLFEAVGALNTSGNKYTFNGSNLNINKSAGDLFKLGVNFINNWKSPNKLTIAAQTALTFRYRTQNSTEFANTTVIDPGFYDVGGTRTAIPGAATRFSIQRITIFQTGLTRIQYGQAFYDNKTDAVANIDKEAFVVEPNIAENGVFRAFLVVRKNATNLNDLNQAEFFEVGKFGGTIGNAGGAVTAANIIAALGYTPENVANKATDLTSPDNVKYPSTLTMINALNNKTAILNTISELEAYTGGSNIVTVTDTARGGQFTYTPAGLTVDNGTVFTSARGGFWKRVRDNFNFVNVKWFGVKGDGATNDITLIRSAANSLIQTKGGTIFFPKGTYVVLDSINSPSSHTIFRGEPGSIIKYNNASTMGIKIRHDSCDVTGLTFRSDIVTPNANASAIFLQGASGCRIYKNNIESPSGSGIAVFSGNSFHPDGRYISSCKNNIIENNIISGMKQYVNDNTDFGGIILGYASLTPVIGNIIRNNILDGNFLSGHGIAIIGAGSRNIISGNIIKRFRQYGITLYQTETNPDYSLNNNTITGNQIDSIGVLTGTTPKGMGVYLQKAFNSVVTSNKISSVLIGAVAVQLHQSGITAAGANWSTISNNSISKIATNFPGIRISNTFETVISGNMVTDVAFGIHLNQGNDISITSNVLSNIRSQGIIVRMDTSSFFNPVPYKTIPTGININISSNTISSGAVGVDYSATTISPSRNSVISGNVIRSVNTGMLIGNLRRSNILGNNINIVSGTGNMIQIQTNSDTLIIANNTGFRTSGTSTYGIFTTGSNDIIYGNRMLNTTNQVWQGSTAFVTDKKRLTGVNFPSSGTWTKGDVIYNSSPSVGSSVGWFCTSSGTPGVWSTLGTIGFNAQQAIQTGIDSLLSASNTWSALNTFSSVNISSAPPSPAGTFNILGRSTQAGTVGNVITAPTLGSGLLIMGTSIIGSGTTIPTQDYVDSKTLSGATILDFPSTTATDVYRFTNISVPGAVVGDVVALGIPTTAVTATGTYSAWVSAADTVTVQFSPKATEDPSSGLFKVKVIK